MNAIRLLNYRCLEDTGVIEIKPLTFLLGANSTGKSSFLKVLPLIKQSTNINVHGSFLWNGSLVDFEDFQNVVRNRRGDITMEFNLSNVPFMHKRFWIADNFMQSVEVSISISGKEERWDYLKSLKVKINDYTIEISFTPKQQKGEFVKTIIVNGVDFSSKYSNIQAIKQMGIIPFLFYKHSDTSVDDEPEYYFSDIENLLHIENDKVDRYAVRRVAIELPIAILTGKNIVAFIKKGIGDNFNEETFNEQAVINASLYNNINNIIESINDCFSNFASNVVYVAPLRANFERYYRFQNYSVNSIDADGHNLAMFLNSLGDDNMNLFNNWLANVFNFEIKLSPSVGHVAIELKEQGKDFRNMVDLGFGYTELLPILAMIWKTVEYDKIKGRRKINGIIKQYTFAIEQPELHLHPRFQAKFAQLIVNVINDAKKHNVDVRFVIETHSEVIINKIGQLIERKSCSHDDVNVVIFNAQHEGLDRYVECTSFSEDGYLNNWPYGFFDEEENAY